MVKAPFAGVPVFDLLNFSLFKSAKLKSIKPTNLFENMKYHFLVKIQLMRTTCSKE